MRRAKFGTPAGARNPARSRRRTLQNVHTHVKLCPPPGRKRVVSYHHSQGTTKLQGQGPGTGGETAVRACSVGTAAFAYCPPAVGADKQHHASRVLKIEGIKKRPGAGTSSGPLCVSKKVALPLFREGSHGGRNSISCEIVAPSAMRSVISEAHVPGNDGFSFDSAACLRPQARFEANPRLRRLLAEMGGGTLRGSPSRRFWGRLRGRQLCCRPLV